MAIRMFARQDLLDRGLPGWCRDGKIIADTIIDKSRWSVHHEIVWRLDEQPEGEAYRAYYNIGATEMQDQRPWEDEDTVEAAVVRQIERVVKVWEPVE